MTLDLFSPPLEAADQQTRAIRLRCIKAVFHTVTIREKAPPWVRARVHSSEAVFNLFGDLAQETKEHFVALHLDSKNRILCYDLVSVGSMTASIVHPREVYKSALLSSASGLVFLHQLCGALHKLCNVKLPVM
ncbi:JAB domain-containing protein [Geoalkalibacter halelectricus]|uniref:JAB domain-containing protein n=1 Tax=Geoalkalibacter halelectricus TaxID=2847045 RepID=UPI0026701142|nr:JAB domain-containing protein [Geoalkalibacter halelectricus]MDO3380493.1 hypothetical protein [Geoalkalibacter halelectricus]